MDDDIDFESTKKRLVAVASKKAFILGNKNNSDKGLPLTLIGPVGCIVFLCVVFQVIKIPLFILFLLVIVEFVVGYGVSIRGGLVGMLSILKYNVFSSKRKNIRN
jgi:hypothetical protein